MRAIPSYHYTIVFDESVTGNIGFTASFFTNSMTKAASESVTSSWPSPRVTSLQGVVFMSSTKSKHPVLKDESFEKR